MDRCPRCQAQNDERAARCARCGAPLRLREEPTPARLDLPLDLDRRQRTPAPPTPPARPSGPPPRAAVAPPTPSPLRPQAGGLERPAPRVPRAEPLPGKPLGVADSHWELGKPPAPARPAPAPPWPAAGAPLPKGAPPAAAPPPTSPFPRPGAPAGGGRPGGPAAAPRPEPTPTAPPPRAPPGPPAGAAAAPAAVSPRAAPLRSPPAQLEIDPDVEVDAIEVHRRRAAPWRRLASWAVDGLLLGLVAAPVIWLVLAAAGPSAKAADIDGLLSLAARQARFIVPTLAFVALASAVYSALSVALMGATLGKRVLGLEVVGNDGRRPSPRRAVARAALTLLSFALLGLGCLLALFTRSGRALHDLLAGTVVVER